MAIHKTSNVKVDFRFGLELLTLHQSMYFPCASSLCHKKLIICLHRSIDYMNKILAAFLGGLIIPSNKRWKGNVFSRMCLSVFLVTAIPVTTADTFKLVHLATPQIPQELFKLIHLPIPPYPLKLFTHNPYIY